MRVETRQFFAGFFKPTTGHFGQAKCYCRFAKLSGRAGLRADVVRGRPNFSSATKAKREALPPLRLASVSLSKFPPHRLKDL